MADKEIKKNIGIIYLFLTVLITFGALASVSLYIAYRPMNFLESGYPVWKVKQSMLVSCDLGSTVVLGDSQADSAIIPNRLSEASTNLGFAGGTPIEVFFFAKQAAECAARPKHLILSFGPAAFMNIQPWLWDNAVRYGLLGWGELSDIRAAAAEVGDESYLEVKTHDGLNGVLRDFLYASHFPSIYFNSLVEGRVFRRIDTNRTRFSEVRLQRGYPTYGNGGGVALPVLKGEFRPLALQQHYFEQTLAMLEKAGIDVNFLITPMSLDRLPVGQRQILAGYLNYLHSLETRYPHFRLLQKEVPVWPSLMFGDGAHLNLNGARNFSDLLKQCLAPANSSNPKSAGADICTFELN